MIYWAKTTADGQPGISVREHCINVGCVARAIVEIRRDCLADKNLAVWLAACHDIGKISPGFQAKCPAWLLQNDLVRKALTTDWTSAEKDHAKVSQFTLQHLFRERGGAGTTPAAVWAAVAGMHHGSPHWRGEWKTSVGGIARGDAWEAHRRELAEELRLLAPPPASLPPADRADGAALWWTAGLITVADWIGSDESFFPATGNGPEATPDTARENARLALRKIGFGPVSVPADRTFADLFGETPYPLQQAALETIRSPGVYVIEAAMGTGKTEAALAAAYELISTGQASGLYFALPTQATSNRIHERVTQFMEKLGGNAPRLVHGNSWLMDADLRFPVLDGTQPDDQRDSARDWFASAKRALLAPFGVGTVDQALLGVIAVKHFFVRHFALAGKVVVIDEVHSYDVFTGTLIEALVRALVKLRCTVIILSATLTAGRRRQLLAASGVEPQMVSAEVDGEESFPLITGVTNGGGAISRPVTPSAGGPPVEVSFRAEAAVLELAVRAAREGSRVLWICNTVDRAQATYRAVCGERCDGDPPVGLLHARFPFFRREQLETEWMAALGKTRGAGPGDGGCLLISTQVVEQSVDLDADLLITELAPTDMLFQRLGRLWRHQRTTRPRARPEMWILQEELPFAELRAEADEKELRRALGPKARVYAPYVLLRTLEQWHDRSHVSLPGDIRRCLEDTYLTRSEDDRPGWQALLKNLEDKRRKHVLQAETMQNVWARDALKDEEGIGTRLNDCPTLPLVLASAVDDKSITFLGGETVAVSTRRFDYGIARAMHRNLVKAPRWWFKEKRRCLQTLPPPVAATVHLHLHGTVEMGVVEGTTILLDSLGESGVLRYDDAQGLSWQPGSAAGAARRQEDEDDEPFD